MLIQILLECFEESRFAKLLVGEFENDWQKLWKFFWRRPWLTRPGMRSVWEDILPDFSCQRIPVGNAAWHRDTGAQYERNPAALGSSDQLLARRTKLPWSSWAHWIPQLVSEIATEQYKSANNNARLPLKDEHLDLARHFSR